MEAKHSEGRGADNDDVSHREYKARYLNHVVTAHEHIKINST